MTIDAKIRKLCARKGWKQADLMRALGDISKATVSNWWTGKTRPNLEDGFRMARALGVSLDYLADDALDEPQPGLTDGEMELLKLGRRVGIEDAINRIVIKHEIVPMVETYGQRKRRNEANNHG